VIVRTLVIVLSIAAAVCLILLILLLALVRPAASRRSKRLRARFPRLVPWLQARLACDPRGFWLTFTVSIGALAAWGFLGTALSVANHDELALFDSAVARWFAAHRVGWITDAAQTATWLGSTIVIVGLLAVAVVFFAVRRRDWRSSTLLVIAVGGATALYNTVQAIVGRARPPSTLSVGHFNGGAFPSGHATHAIVLYIMLAVLVGSGRSTRTRVLLWAGAAAAVLVVGASRVYLGAHWLSDVLGGYALGTAWLSAVLAADRLRRTRGPKRRVGEGEEEGLSPVPPERRPERPPPV
jgi:membrane-associated phospholipid phosphatase